MRRRVDESGAQTPVGSSFITGFVDRNVQIDQTYRYVVTSYTVDGVESAPTQHSSTIEYRKGGSTMLVHRHSFQRQPGLRHFWWLGAVLMLLCTLSIAPAPASSAPFATSAAPQAQEQPTVLVPSPVYSYTLAGSKIFWTTSGKWTCGEFGEKVGVQSLNRIATYGSPVRQLFLREPKPCEGFLLGFSALVADDQYIYFLDLNNDGLFRLSTNANVGEAPELLDADWQGLAIDLGAVYGFGFQNGSTVIKRFSKTDSSVKALTTVPANASFLSSDGKYLYWRSGDKLMRYELSTGAQATFTASGVTSYYATGEIEVCNGICTVANYVYVAQGKNIIRYANGTTTSSTPFYLSPDSSARIYSMTADKANNLFFFEQRTTSCPLPCFPNDTDLLIRIANSGSQASVIAVEALVDTQDARMNLTTDGTFVFWKIWNYTDVKRLPTNAGALPLTNMRITGIEVTQGIQNLNNSVPLIRGRRTFVRVYVQSDGDPVPGVTMHLSNDANPLQEKVYPINDVGPRITVPKTRVREDLNNSFLFELPLSWTYSDLKLRAELNPNRVPPQASYANNSRTFGPFSFVPSPRLEVQLVEFAYRLNNVNYIPTAQDEQGVISLARRLLPLASTPGYIEDLSSGFRPNVTLQSDDGLPSRVDQTNEECKSLLVKNPDGTIKADYRNMCATYYANGQLAKLRSAWGLAENTFMYGMIAHPPEISVRGVNTGTSSGAAESPETAIHEIVHSLGRNHPFSGSVDDDNKCGNSLNDGGYDKEYPYPDSQIGPTGGDLMGFEGGDASLGIAKATRPAPATSSSPGWYDIIGYCGPQWISDYTYTHVLDFMNANPPALLQSTGSSRVSGDFLSVIGLINPSNGATIIHDLSRLNAVAAIPSRTPGVYSIRLLNGQGKVVADYRFTPEMAHNGAGMLAFNQVVPFVANTTQLRIVNIASGQTLISRTISADAPVVSNVTLQGTTNPVVGNAMLTWSASDADGDALKFDVLYSRNGGATFQPLQINLHTTSAQIDTSQLGGGQTIFRVLASDGANTAQADSAPFTVAAKPPQPRILNPGDGARVHWGTLINFMGEATDPQDGGVSGSGLIWTNQKGMKLGTGAVLTRDDLPVGVNKITLTATNSAGLSASASVTVIVDDNLNLPGPTLSVGPTQIGWHVAPGTTTPQTAQLTISNAGSGDLNWTASSNQPWLTVSAASGTVKAREGATKLTVTANPSGLQRDKSHLATLTLSKPASGGEPAQTIVIPASLSVGETFNPPAQAPSNSRRIYLPFIRR